MPQSALSAAVGELAGVDISEPARPRPSRRAAREAFRLPDGQVYVDRRIGGRSVLDVLDGCRTLRIGVCLYGPPGTGKTMCVEAYAHWADPDTGDEEDPLPHITTECDEGTDAATLVGGFVPARGGGFGAHYGDACRAMRKGRVHLLDDVTNADPRPIARLYPAFDARRRISVRELDGEVVLAGDGYFPILAYNPEVGELAEPLRSRFPLQVEARTDFCLARDHLCQAEELASRSIRERERPQPPRRSGRPLPGYLVDVAEALDEKCARGECGWAPQLRELTALRTLCEAFDEQFALAALQTMAPPEDRDQVRDTLSAVAGDDRLPEPLALARD